MPDAGAGDEERPVRWGLREAGIAFGVAIVAQVLLTPLVFALTGQALDTDYDDLPITVIALLQIPLWLGLGGVPLLVTRRMGNGVVRDLGLRWRPSDVPSGLAIGVLVQAIAVPLLYLPIFWLSDLTADDVAEDARALTDRATGAGVVLLILVVAVGAPVIEELFYRGLLLRSLERRFGPGWALVGSTLVFGISHFQAVQLPALLLFGAVAGWLALRSGRLGPSILCHVGFNAWTLFELLVRDG